MTASLGERGTERYFAKHLDEIIFQKLTLAAPEQSPGMCRTATVFLRHALLGLYLDFVDYRGKIDKENLAARIGTLANGVLLSLKTETL